MEISVLIAQADDILNRIKCACTNLVALHYAMAEGGTDLGMFVDAVYAVSDHLDYLTKELEEVLDNVRICGSAD